jgi:tRNA isopentenyl-2-thiomethyl-A-37 hydroxylase MiaE
MQKVDDCDFFVWADKEMSPYEKGLTKYLREMEEKRIADNDWVDAFIEEKCNEHYDKLRRDLELGQNDKVNALIGKKMQETLR